MKSISAGLQAILRGRQWIQCDLYQIIFHDTTIAYYTNGEVDLGPYVSGGQTGPYFDRTGSEARIKWRKGLEVDTMQLDVIPGSSTIRGVSWYQAALGGLFDGAELNLYRAFRVNPSDALETCLLYVGAFGEIEASRSVIHFTLNSHLELLNQQLPRTLYQPGCVNNLGDAACGVSLNSFGTNAAALLGSSASVIIAENLSNLTTWDQGFIGFTSGANTGITRMVKDWRVVFIRLQSPFPVAPNVGDTFTIYPGCDKTLGSDGCAKFSNQARYRGFPFIPVPETAV